MYEHINGDRRTDSTHGGGRRPKVRLVIPSAAAAVAVAMAVPEEELGGGHGR